MAFIEEANNTTSRKFSCLSCGHVWYVLLYRPLLLKCPLCGKYKDDRSDELAPGAIAGLLQEEADGWYLITVTNHRYGPWPSAILGRLGAHELGITQLVTKPLTK